MHGRTTTAGYAGREDGPPHQLTDPRRSTESARNRSRQARTAERSALWMVVPPYQRRTPAHLPRPRRRPGNRRCGPSPPECEICPDGGWGSAAGADGEVASLDEAMTQLSELEHPGNTTSGAIIPAGSRFAEADPMVADIADEDLGAVPAVSTAASSTVILGWRRQRRERTRHAPVMTG
jgi:hypothetical protein